MSTKQARDFLDKELFVNRSIVTFRSLSRELGIHVNDAKNELQLYYDSVCDTDVPAVPTYLVSGEVPALTIKSLPVTQQSDFAMDVDLEFEEGREAKDDVVYQTKVLLVDASKLDATMSQFSRIQSVHVYSLSPSRLVDAGLVCTPSSKVRQADARGGPASFSVVGKITGAHVKLKSGALNQRTASSSKMTLDAPAKAAPKAVVPTKTEQKTTSKGKIPASEPKVQASTTPTLPRGESADKPKPSGKLDWSKAKTKNKGPVMEKTKEEKKLKLGPDPAVDAKDASKKKSGPGLSNLWTESSGPSKGKTERGGIKRESHESTDLESEFEPSTTKAKSKSKAGSLLQKVDSDDDDDDDDDGAVRMLGQRRPKRKATITSDSEISLRAMMDIDDEQVNRVSKASKVRPQPEESEESEEAEAIETEKSATLPPATSDGEESDDIPIVPKKSRKSRKVVPVGRNGLKKRRVVKSRTTTDAKGYMQTEDYSSYESIEEEEEAEAKPKGKGRATKKALELEVAERAKPKAVIEQESAGNLKAKAAPKPTRGGAPKRGGLLNFFGPERGKK